jgi:hypothetical protein
MITKSDKEILYRVLVGGFFNLDLSSVAFRVEDGMWPVITKNQKSNVNVQVFRASITLFASRYVI